LSDCGTPLRRALETCRALRIDCKRLLRFIDARCPRAQSLGSYVVAHPIRFQQGFNCQAKLPRQRVHVLANILCLDRFGVFASQQTYSGIERSVSELLRFLSLTSHRPIVLPLRQ